ncbi:Transposon TX1 uncharacterized 149 kDa protein [Frankliniella fusca]|uniref:Transposon TX1 uncharacterized 149 kDa protein n=1 Tax=Frankliniella fusca TaxID=407009 RepID=A0AAE1GVR8_9NEOP|nr:Transposon TX1 uncharacterized 149 kDa protein [Frankliniella fusca]
MSARLDRVYVPPTEAVQDAEVVAVAFSDHCALRVGLAAAGAAGPRPLRTRAAWRFDCRILTDPAYLPSLQEEWARCVAARGDADVTEWWPQHAKPAIRRHAAKFTREWRRDCRSKLLFLYELLQELITASPRPAGYVEHIKETKTEILMVHAVMLEGVKVRAALDEVVRDEPVSAVHVGRAARRARQQDIKNIQDADGQVLTDPADVRQLFYTLYEAKFKAPAEDDVLGPDSPILAAATKVLDDADNEALCRPFTVDEVYAAVKKCPRRKSPGADGLQGEFYVGAWGVVGEALTEFLNAVWERRRVPPAMSRGIITLIPKKPRPVVAKDFRPITLLDVDVKTLDRLMTERLSTFQDRLLHPNQVRPGGKRSMAHALCDLRDVLSALDALRLPGAVLSIDFSSAFDSVRHDFLFEVLRRRGVGAHYVDVLRSLYAGASSQLRVNGELTASFPVGKSVRQGSPASMLYFSIVLAPLMIVLEERLQGLALANSCMRVSAYADDAFLVLRDHDEAAAVMDVLQDYGATSGLLANPEKCGVLTTGGWRREAPVAFPYVEKLKVLGITFHANIKATIKDNWAAVIASVRGVLRDHSPRGLGLTQRAEFVSIYALSRMWHVGQVLPVPKGAAAAVEKAIRTFLWRGQFFTTAMAVTCTPRAQGGLGIPVGEKKCDAFFTGRWQGALVDTPDSFAGEWLQVLLGAFPLGVLQQRVWPEASHFMAFNTCRTKAAAAEPEVDARSAIRAIYNELVNAAPAPLPRVVAKAPDVQWQRVWANVRHEALPEDVQDSWWKAVHDLPATRHRLKRIGRSESRACPTCAAPDTLAHRLARCSAVLDAWRWTRATLTKLLGSAATPRTLLQPDFAPENPDRHATAAWVAGQHVHLVVSAASSTPAAFALHIMRAKRKALAHPSCPPPLQRGLAQYVQ